MKIKNIPNIEVGARWIKFKPEESFGNLTDATEVLISFYYPRYMVEISTPKYLCVYEDVKRKNITKILAEHFKKKIKCSENDIVYLLSKGDN